MTYILLLIGFVFLIKGAGFLVDGASSLAKKFNISNLVICLTVVAFGTSAPELFVNLFASFNGTTDIAIGNIVGSNIVNILFILGIAAIFVPILNIYTISLMLVFISVYDAWAVWHSGIMQKMAKYQINKLNVFSGFFVPYASNKIKLQIQKMKKSELKKKIKVNVAILGGGDVVFPIITAGVMMKTLGILPAVFVIAGATLGLGYLFLFAEKKKFYPAMPFITAGIFLGILAGYLLF